MNINIEHYLPVMIFAGVGTNLLRRNCFNIKVDWTEIFHTFEKNDKSEQHVLEKHTDLISEELYMMIGFEDHFPMMETAKPMYF